MKVIIIGAGIAGLAAATLLSECKNVDVTIYEKSNIIGGQIASQYNGTCYVEYSWRVFGNSYYNLFHIINKLNILENFKPIISPCYVNNETTSSANLSVFTQLCYFLQNSNNGDITKLLNLIIQSKNRNINEYDTVGALDFFNDSPIIKAIIGPFLGMDARYVSLSGVLKNLYSVSDNNKNPFVNETMITKLPTQQALCDYWEKHLINNKVNIIKNAVLENIIYNDKTNSIESIVVNNKVENADEYIFACSIEPLLKIINKNNILMKIPTLQKMINLTNGLQLYFTINLYFSEKVNETNECSEIVILDMSWQPIIQKKRLWDKNILQNCKIKYSNKQIVDVWNVGFIDNFKGKYNNKIVSECSLDEAVIEGVLQIKNSEYIKTLFNEGKQFEDLLIGIDYWYQFKNDENGKIIAENPKFSINKKIIPYMPSNHNDDMPENMHLAGYYVNSTMGGVSMEASTETGLIASKYIMKKHNLMGNINDDILPIIHNNESFTTILKPLNKIDEILYDLKLKSCVEYVNPFIIIVIYITIVLIIIYYIIYALFNVKFAYNYLQKFVALNKIKS